MVSPELNPLCFLSRGSERTDLKQQSKQAGSKPELSPRSGGRQLRGRRKPVCVWGPLSCWLVTALGDSLQGGQTESRGVGPCCSPSKAALPTKPPPVLNSSLRLTQGRHSSPGVADLPL